LDATIQTVCHDSNLGKRRESSLGKHPLEMSTNSTTLAPRILLADDQQDVLDALRLLLKGHGFVTEAVNSPAGLLEAVAAKEFDLLLMDLNYARDTTSGREGLDLLGQLKELANAPPIVVMTGWATIGLAVEVMQNGVGDFIEKPWSNIRLLEILRKQIALGQERREMRRREMQQQQSVAAELQHLHAQEHEIAEAWEIQKGLLPKEVPQIAGCEISSVWQPAHVVGGDYFDAFAVGPESFGFCIADVAGKGLPAALLMANLQAGVRGLASPELRPHALCTQLNTLVYGNVSGDRFITFFYAELDARARRLSYTNAGHNAPFVMHGDGTHDRLREGGGVLGVFRTQNFLSEVFQLRAGDRVIFYTDGLTEAADADAEEFGEARLLRLLEEHRNLSAENLQKTILDSVAGFCNHVWSDDATLLVLALS
jgi:sigma-B regulation protein RsbU (phosphoserine phosphatase)